MEDGNAGGRRAAGFLRSKLIIEYMEVVYLEDGRKANLVAKTENGYVVDPFSTYSEYDNDEEYDEPSGKVLQVARVFKEAPIDVVNAEYKAILDKIAEAENQVRDKRNELSQLEYKIKNTATQVDRYIINREQLRLAKRLIVFKKEAIAPMVMGGDKSYKFTVSYEISQYQNEERCWVSSLWNEDKNSNWGSSQYFDAEYGIMTDLTDEQIKAITLERQTKYGIKHFCENQIIHTCDEWLTPEFQIEKKRLIEFNKGAELRRATDELKKAQEKYNCLINKNYEVVV
jgi:hypothetical protein